jgi:hypothetical protein
MANNRIQIKRSVANATVTGLSNGELAFTQASNTLHIGLPDGSGVLRIGGAQYPGVLTNNHALVANTTGGIDKVIVANAVIATLTANGSAGTNGQVLVTNGTAIYWGTGTSGANTQIQFNDSGVANATAGFTFDKVTNTMFIGNSITFGATGNNQLISLSNSFLEVRGGWADNNGVLSVIGGNYTDGNYAKIALQGNNKTVTIESDNTLVKTLANSTIATANLTGVYVVGTVNAAVHSTAGNFSNTSGNYPLSNTVGAELGDADQRWVISANTISATGLIDGNAGLTITGTANVSSAINIPGYLVANQSGIYHTGTVNALSYTVGSNYSVNSTALVYGGGTVNATSATLNVRDANISGNLIVSGTVISINVATLSVNDNIISLGDNNLTTDLVDTGWYSPAGNSSAVWYSGFVRVAGDSSVTNPYFKLFATPVNPNTASTIAANAATGTLQAFLTPYGVGGAFVANSSNVQITANSTIGVNIVANTLTLTTALAGIDGGTGYKTTTNQAILVGNTSNGYSQLVLGSEGFVLQSNGTALLYDYLDGGSF